MEKTFEFCSLQYMNFWLSVDRECHVVLKDSVQSGNKLSLLQKAASFYRISRNLPKGREEAEGLPRFSFLQSIIDQQTSSELSVLGAVEMVKQVSAELSNKYWGAPDRRNLLSAASKFLWLKIRDPIIIYDSQARLALNVPNGNYEHFYTAWIDSYTNHKEEIREISHKLKDQSLYFEEQPENISEIEEIISQEWFHRRVFDIWLWNKGKPAR